MHKISLHDFVGMPSFEKRDKSNMNKKGFTLVELMVVMAIIGILAVVGFSSYEGTRRSARDSRRKTDLESIRGAFELYKADVKSYPNSLSCGTSSSIANGGSTYLAPVPCDPKDTSTYGFGSSGTSSYTIGAYLENAPTTSTCGSTTLTCGSYTCNYCVTNP